MRGLGLAGSSVFGSRRRGWTPAAPGAAALSEVWLAPDFVGWRVPWRRWCAPVACLTPTGLVVSLGRVATFSPGGMGSIIQQMSNSSLSFAKPKRWGPAVIRAWKCTTAMEGLLSVVTRAPPSVSMVVLGVGRITAVSRRVGALILTSLASSPPWRLAQRAPYSCAPAIDTPSIFCNTHLSHLVPDRGAVDLVLSQQRWLDACRAGSQHVELL